MTRIFDSTSAELAMYATTRPPTEAIQAMVPAAGADSGEVERRSGDPITVDALEFNVQKFFPRTTSGGLAYVSVASTTVDGQTVLVTLTAPDRAVHDRFYQTFRDTVRTIRVRNTGGVAH